MPFESYKTLLYFAIKPFHNTSIIFCPVTTLFLLTMSCLLDVFVECTCNKLCAQAAHTHKLKGNITCNKFYSVLVEEGKKTTPVFNVNTFVHFMHRTQSLFVKCVRFCMLHATMGNTCRQLVALFANFACVM